MKCTRCNSSRHVTCLQKGKVLLATASTFATLAFLYPRFKGGAKVHAMEAGRSVIRKVKYYCSDCKYEFEEDLF